MQNCEYHPDKPAVATCNMCGVPLCGHCASPDEHGRVICRRCFSERLVKSANSELLETETDPYLNKFSNSKRKIFSSINIFLVVGILLILVEGVLYLCMDSNSLKDKPMNALDNIEVPCALVLSALKRYHTKYEFYPKDLDELKDGFLSKKVDTSSLKYRKDERGGFELLLWDKQLKRYFSYTKNGCSVKTLQQGDIK